MKWLIRIVAVVAVLVIVLVVGVWLMLDGLVKSAVESAGASATGVETKLDGVSVGLFSGAIGLQDFSLANPEGFKADAPLFAMSSADVQVQPGSLLSDTVMVNKAHIDGAHVTVAFENGKLNISEVMKHIQEATGGEEDDTTADDAEGKKVVIEDLRITNTKVTGAIALIPGSDPIEIDMVLADIIKENVGSDGSGMTMGDVTGFVMETIFENVTTGIADKIPGLGDLAGMAGDVGAKATEALDKVGGDATKAIDGAGKKLEEGLGGLLGGKKKKE